MNDSTRRLAESEEQYRTVAEFTHDWEYWLSPDGEYRYVSPACLRITGYPTTAFLNDPNFFLDIVHPDDREGVQETMAKLNALNKPMRFDCRIILRNGTERWIAHNSIPGHPSLGK